MNGWGIHRLRDMVGSRFNHAYDGTRWYRAVPLPYRGPRIKPALAVLLGRAYAVQWPELGEWEALHQPEWPDEIPDIKTERRNTRNSTMASKAAKLKKKRISRGRPRKAGAERHPCGKIKQDWSQRESEQDAMSVAITARGKIHGLNENNALAGYTLGRIYLDGNIAQHQLEAGNEYAEDMARYYRLTGIPFPSARAQSVGGVRGSDGDVSQSRADAARRASNRMMELEGILLRCEDGPQVKTTVRNVCLMDMETLRLMPERQMLWLRRGLDALHVAKHLRKSAA